MRSAMLLEERRVSAVITSAIVMLYLTIVSIGSTPAAAAGLTKWGSPGATLGSAATPKRVKSTHRFNNAPANITTTAIGNFGSHFRLTRSTANVPAPSAKDTPLNAPALWAIWAIRSGSSP